MLLLVWLVDVLSITTVEFWDAAVDIKEEFALVWFANTVALVGEFPVNVEFACTPPYVPFAALLILTIPSMVEEIV